MTSSLLFRFPSRAVRMCQNRSAKTSLSRFEKLFLRDFPLKNTLTLPWYFYNRKYWYKHLQDCQNVPKQVCTKEPKQVIINFYRTRKILANILRVFYNKTRIISINVWNSETTRSVRTSPDSSQSRSPRRNVRWWLLDFYK